MALKFRYNTQLNVKPRILKIFSYWEFFIGLIISGIPVALSAIFGLKPSFLDSLVFFIGYCIFLSVFKVGKPEGYLEHLIEHWHTPVEFRPGHKIAQFPIGLETIDELIKAKKRTHEDLWEAQQVVQLYLLKNHNLVIVDRLRQKYVKLNPETPEGKKLLGEYEEKIRSGIVIGIGSRVDVTNELNNDNKAREELVEKETA